MSRLRSLIAVALLMCLVPGAAEALEAAAHLVVHGHLPHASGSGHDHPEPGPEHGCTGTLHVCACHRTVAQTVAGAVPGIATAQARLLLAGRCPWPSHDATSGVFRPPRA